MKSKDLKYEYFHILSLFCVSMNIGIRLFKNCKKVLLTKIFIKCKFLCVRQQFEENMIE